MALTTQALGKEYFGICDHSKSAFYANGLSVERVVQQHAEIDKLNQKFENTVLILHKFKLMVLA
jgi:DNA polymerase (family 10)